MEWGRACSPNYAKNEEDSKQLRPRYRQRKVEVRLLATLNIDSNQIQQQNLDRVQN